MMPFLSLLLLLLIHQPSRCAAKPIEFKRGTQEDDEDNISLQSLLARISSLEEDRSFMKDRISFLEQERQALTERLQTLEEKHHELSSQHERRLQDSCIAQDSKEAGGFFIDNCNLHVRAGTGTTDRINGLGNLIVGYNEEDSNHHRTGSHNIVVGTAHDYKSHSGIVSGRSNNLNRAAAVAIGGHSNSVDGAGSTIVGGSGNVARSDMANLVGGTANVGAGLDSVIVGGASNTAQGQGSVVVGGKGNTEIHTYATTVGP